MKQMETKEEESIGWLSTPWKTEGDKVVRRWSKSAEETK